MKISVIGTGYLGATHAACLAEIGHDVVGLDVDPAKVELLAAGRVPFHEPGLAQLVRTHVASGRLVFTTDESQLADADVHFICVGTPQAAGSLAVDLTAVDAAVDVIARAASPDSLVVGKSTVPAGTATCLRRRLIAAWDRPVSVCWNPEFLREGRAVQDSLRPDRLVLGVEHDAAYERLLDVYAPLCNAGVPVIRTDLATAELAKVSANVMLAARVSVINVLAEVCEAAGGDVEALAAVLRADHRIGSAYLRPGIGFGGSCLPKDVRGFVAQACELGVGDSAALLGEVDSVNMRQRAQVVDAALVALGDDTHRRVAVLGAAFKKDSDDLRDSPAVDTALTLHRQGADVVVHDPRALGALALRHPELATEADVLRACTDADVVMVLTDWDEYADLDPVALAEVVRRPQVVDGRLVLHRDKWRAAGWNVHHAGWAA